MDDLTYIKNEEMIKDGGYWIICMLCLILVIPIPLIPFIIYGHLNHVKELKKERQRRKEKGLKYFEKEGFFEDNIRFSEVDFKYKRNKIVNFKDTFESQYFSKTINDFNILIYAKDEENNCYKYVYRRDK